MVEAIPVSHELNSPCSVNEVMELMDHLQGNSDFSKEIIKKEDSSQISRFVCITDPSGNVKYSNIDELKQNSNLIKNIRLECKNEKELIEKITQIQNQSITIINGLFCFLELDSEKISTLLKLQKHDQLFIWTFKKVSVSEIIGKKWHFQIQDSFYKFTKFKTVLAVDKSGKILNYQNDLFKYFFNQNNLEYLHEILEIPTELKSVLQCFSDKNHQIDYYQKFSVSSLDLFVDVLHPIFSAKCKLVLTENMTIELNLYDYIHIIDNGPVFPIQIKYSEASDNNFNTSPDLDNYKFPKFDGFKIIRKLSRSNHSTIYEAVDLSNNKVVIKVIHGEKHNELKFYDYFCNESRKLSCEFIEKPLKIVAKSTQPAIFMKCLPNRCDLFEFINKNTFLTIDAIKRIFLQIATAVDFLHSHGIIHRDIKDENILIEQDTLRITLIDFGSSAFLNDKEMNFGEYMGTFSYAPVEVLKGNPFNGPEQDIWSLGILLYVLCFKEPPFHSVKEILQGILRLPIERPFGITHLIRQMLEPKPQNRPNIKTILNSEFLK